MPTTGPTKRLATARVDWVDYAKGICIFFVVMLHVNDYVQEQAHATGWLEDVVTFARPFRMPDFFLIAGLFLASAMRRPWLHYIDRKIVHFLYFYALWMTLQFGVLELPHLLRADGASALGIAANYFRRFIDPVGPLWFIHILPVFFLLTRLTLSVPPWLMWLGAATLHSLHVDTGWHVPDELSSRYVYFYSGYILAPYVFRIAAWTQPRVLVSVGYLSLWGVVNALVVAAGWAELPIVSLALGYAGALAVIITAALLSRLSWTRPLRFLGQNSIVVYLGELGVSLIVIHALLPLSGDVGWVALLSTALTVIGTIALWRVMRRTPARFMYERPAWFQFAVDRPPAAHRAPADSTSAAA